MVGESSGASRDVLGCVCGHAPLYVGRDCELDCMRFAGRVRRYYSEAVQKRGTVQGSSASAVPMGSSHQVSDPDASSSSASGHTHGSGTVPRSAMNPDYEYVLPAHIAHLMGGPIQETEEEELLDQGQEGTSDYIKKDGDTSSSGSGVGRRGRPRRVLQLASMAATQPGGTGFERRMPVDPGSGRSSARGPRGSSTAPLAGAAAATSMDGSLRLCTDEPGSTIVVAPYDLTRVTTYSTSADERSQRGGAVGTFSTFSSVPSGISEERWHATETPPGPRSEGLGFRKARARVSEVSTAGRSEEAPARGPWAADVGKSATDLSAGDKRIPRLQRLLDAFGEDDLFLGRFEMLGRQHRRRGGVPAVCVCVLCMLCCAAMS